MFYKVYKNFEKFINIWKTKGKIWILFQIIHKEHSFDKVITSILEK